MEASVRYGILHVLVSIANVQITEAQWGLKTWPLVFSAGITEYPDMAQSCYEDIVWYSGYRPCQVNGARDIGIISQFQ